MPEAIGEIQYDIDWPKVIFESNEKARKLLEITMVEAAIVARRNALFRRYPRAHPGASAKGLGLAESIYTKTSRTATGYSGTIGSHLDYAASVEDGARPHIIRPRRQRDVRGRYIRSGYLHFYWWKEGHWVITKKVRHPGQAGKHFLRDALVSVGKRRGFNVDIY